MGYTYLSLNQIVLESLFIYVLVDVYFARVY